MWGGISTTNMALHDTLHLGTQYSHTTWTILIHSFIGILHSYIQSLIPQKISSNPPGAKFYSLQYHPDPHYSPFPTKKVPFKRVSLIFGQVVWGLFEPVTITSQIQKSKVLPVTSRRWKPSTCGPFCWQKRRPQCEAPVGYLSWCITPITIVDGIYNELVTGANLNQLITGGPHIVWIKD